MEEKDQAALLEISRQSGKSVSVLLSESVQLLKRQYYLSELNLGYAEVRENALAYEELRHEQALWDVTARDGLE